MGRALGGALALARSPRSRLGSSSHRNVKPQPATSLREITRVPATWPWLGTQGVAQPPGCPHTGPMLETWGVREPPHSSHNVCPALPAHERTLLISQVRVQRRWRRGAEETLSLTGTLPRGLWPRAQGDGQGSGRLGLLWSGLPRLDQRPPGQSVLCYGGCPVHPAPVR